MPYYFLQIVSKGENLHEMSKPFFWEKKKKNINLSSAELQREWEWLRFDAL